jgi:hypothetical protein
MLMAPDVGHQLRTCLPLHTQVNCGIVHNLAPAPHLQLCPTGIRTPWIKPGRAVWRYLEGRQATLGGVKEFLQLVVASWHAWRNETLTPP